MSILFCIFVSNIKDSIMTSKNNEELQWLRKLENMAVHEEIVVANDTVVLRVVGGWIYKFINPVGYGIGATTFVQKR